MGINFDSNLSKADFWRLLFSESDYIYRGSEYGTELAPYAEVSAGLGNFFSINPLRDRRADIEVTDYRNFLFEMDNTPLDQQEQILNSLSDIFTTIVYSGGKSYHAIVSLSDHLPWEPHTPESVDKYKALWQNIAQFINEKAGGQVVDQACKNPSRLSRAPGAVRQGVVQRLVHLGTLKSLKDLEHAGVTTSITVKPRATFDGLNPNLTTVLALRSAMSPGLQIAIDYAKTWAQPAGMYPEIYRLTMWAIDDTGTPKETLIQLFKEKCFPALREVGYPEYKMEKAIHDAYREKVR